MCIFAKPPLAGAVKTRLEPTLGAEGAAALARAFIVDTWNALCARGDVQAILATTPGVHTGMGVGEEAVWLQGDGDLGARIERVLQRALDGATVAVALGADTPGLPARLLSAALGRLADHDAVIGPTEDGGFYLLGLRRCPAGLLDGLAWSAPCTFELTLARLQQRGLDPFVLPTWWDVDRPEDVQRLRLALQNGELTAPQTAAVLGVT